MTEQQPQFSKELLERLETTSPEALLTDRERQRRDAAIKANEEARFESERIIRTEYLD